MEYSNFKLKDPPGHPNLQREDDPQQHSEEELSKSYPIYLKLRGSFEDAKDIPFRHLKSGTHRPVTEEGIERVKKGVATCGGVLAFRFPFIVVVTKDPVPNEDGVFYKEVLSGNHRLTLFTKNPEFKQYVQFI